MKISIDKTLGKIKDISLHVSIVELSLIFRVLSYYKENICKELITFRTLDSMEYVIKKVFKYLGIESQL